MATKIYFRKIECNKFSARENIFIFTYTNFLFCFFLILGSAEAVHESQQNDVWIVCFSNNFTHTFIFMYTLTYLLAFTIVSFICSLLFDLFICFFFPIVFWLIQNNLFEYLHNFHCDTACSITVLIFYNKF